MTTYQKTKIKKQVLNQANAAGLPKLYLDKQVMGNVSMKPEGYPRMYFCIVWNHYALAYSNGEAVEFIYLIGTNSF